MRDITFVLLNNFLNLRIMTKEQIREELLRGGVEYLIQFCCPDANVESILTDRIHKEFFKSMLKDNLGRDTTVDEIITELLTEIN
jgi:hypothetical protein